MSVQKDSATRVVIQTGSPPTDSAAGNPVQVAGNFTPAGSFVFPAFDYMSFSYWTTTNNIHQQVFRSGGSGGTVVATLTYAYDDASVDDALVTSITQT